MLMTTLDRKASRRETALLRTLLLQTILGESKRRSKGLKLVFIDVAKAFDSVTHKILAEAALEAGVDFKMVQYIVDNYKRQGTILEMQGATRCVKPGRGVRQGNSLSPVLFNLAMDRTLKKLPASTGVMVGEHGVNHLAYADNVVLLAEIKTGLQHLLDEYQRD